MSFLNKLINPVVSMELRLRMRTKKTPWVISLYLLTLGAVIFTFIYLETGGNAGYFNPNRSRELFIVLSFMQFGLIALVTPGLTAGAISGEREKQTLNILLTTSLTPRKIILGKWLSSLSFIILLIIASLPVYSIVFLYGGISPIQLIKVFGIYLSSMLAIGGVGILFSTLIRRTGVAMIITYTVIIGYTILTMILPEIIRGFYYTQGYTGTTHQVPSWIEWFYSVNPFYIMLNVFEQRPIANLKIDAYWVFISFFIAITIIALLLAIYKIKPVRQWRLFKK